jgi:hypothetical protein
MQNFSYSGSFASGRTYKTNVLVLGVSKQDAMGRASRKLTQDGWQLVNTDKDAGVLSASQSVSYGNGKTVPLNVIIEEEGKDVTVSTTYSTPGGVSSPLDAIARQFCDIIEAVDKK